MSEKIANLSGAPSGVSIFFRVAIAVFLITVLTSVAITFILPEAYSSTARVLVKPDPEFPQTPETSKQNDNFANLSYDPYFIQTTFEIIESKIVLSQVVQKLNLSEIWGKKYSVDLNSEQTMYLLKKRLVLTPVRNTQLINVQVFSENPKEAATIANAVAESYRNFRDKNRIDLMKNSIAGMEHEFQKQEEQINQARTELEALKNQSQASDIKKQKLEQLLKLHDNFGLKLQAAKIDVQLPNHIATVQITDTAEPGKSPVRPNKPLNIFIGVIAGIFLGLAIGAIVLILSKWRNRGGGNVATA